MQEPQAGCALACTERRALVAATRTSRGSRHPHLYTRLPADPHYLPTSACSIPACVQIDAAINPGNSGGPALQNDKVVGVAFQDLEVGGRGLPGLGGGWVWPSRTWRWVGVAFQDLEVGGC